MTKRHLLSLCLLLLASGNTWAKTPVFKHVIMIGSDGFSAEALVKHPEQFPNLCRLMERGSYSMHARAVLPSSSAINWITTLTGAGSEMHGFTDWGSKTPEVKPAYVSHYGMFPGIFGVLRDQRPDAVSGVIYSWEGIGYLFEKQAVTLNAAVEEGNDDEVAKQACQFIEQQKPTLAFVYFSSPDHAGHEHGWMGAEYMRDAHKVDSLIGVVVDCIDRSLDPKSTAIIFTSDHGGIGTRHGGKSMEEMEVPYIMVGRGIPAAHPIQNIVMKYDNAPTIAAFLRLKAPIQWYGKVVVP